MIHLLHHGNSPIKTPGGKPELRMIRTVGQTSLSKKRRKILLADFLTEVLKGGVLTEAQRIPFRWQFWASR